MKLKEIKFSIPYNGDIDVIKWAVESDKVYEVYFAGPKNYDFSDPYQRLKFHSKKEIKILIKFCNKNKIEVNFLINKNILFFEDKSKIIKYIKELQGSGVINIITISDPFIVSYIRKEFSNIKLQSSIFMGIDNIFKVKEAFKMGITEFCLDPAINRNIAELESIYKFKEKHPFITIKLLGMHGCYTNCFYAWKHSDLPILSNVLKKSYFKSKKHILGSVINIDSCHYRIENISDEIKRPFIRPEDITYYEERELADYIKIAYRNDSSELLKQKLKAYFNRSYEGNLFYLIYSNKVKEIFCDNKKIPKGFIEKVMNCNKDCDCCNYCSKVSRECLRIVG